MTHPREPFPDRVESRTVHVAYDRELDSIMRVKRSSMLFADT